ncbi:MAG: hypothetical protein AAB512_00605 [Patescibacteria group bacterium]
MVEQGSRFRASQIPQGGEATLGSAIPDLSVGQWARKKYSWEEALPHGFTSDVFNEHRPSYGLDRLNFPRDIKDFKDMQRSVLTVDRVISLMDLGVDFEKAFWAEVELGARLKTPKFLEGEEHLRGPATLVLGQGLATFYGLDFYRRAAPWARNFMTHGTYNHPIQYLEAAGVNVAIAKTDPLINRGNIKNNEMSIKTAVERARMVGNGPVYLLGHSVDALSAQVFMAKNRKIAKELDGIMLFAGPLPDKINPWIGDIFLALSDQAGNFEFIEPVLDLYRCGDANEMNIVSIKDSPDRVLDGWAGGIVIEVEDGHSSILHQLRNLRGIVHYINETSYPQAQLAA